MSKNKNNSNHKNSNKKKNYDTSTKKIKEDKIDTEKKSIDKEVIIEKKELNNLIDEDLGKKKDINDKKKGRRIFINFFLTILLIISLVYFGMGILDKGATIITLVSNSLLTLFCILFVIIGITSGKKNKNIVFMGGVLLLAYFVIGLVNNNSSLLSNIGVPDFSGKDLTYVMKWASKNNITVKQEYEYSDMIGEYKIISQDIKDGDKLKDTSEITVSVSEGPNPSKEVIVPSMLTWESEKVLNYIKDNYLTNVSVEFVESDKKVDTVIEQNKSGSLKRDDELKLTFSYGEELGYDEVNLIDFSGMSKFEVLFYMKQHHLKYEFKEEFSNKVKKGFVVKQNIKPGKMVKIDDETVEVTISKGPKIKIPNLRGMSVEEVTEWAIKNKLKLEFTNKYDDSIKENNVISVNYKKDEIIEQGTVVKIVISRGKLKMPKFKNFNDFRDWADKYEIKYEEKHEFNDDVAIGEVISFSYKNGDTIKNDDTIVVVISDGAKCEVPNLKGLTKSEAISKLEKAKLNYSFVYKASNDVSKDRVISQSISAGSDVSSGTTVTVTLSNGKKETTTSNRKPGNSGSSSSSSKPSGGNNNSGGGSSNTPPACDRSKTTTIYIDASFISNNPDTTCSNIRRAYPNIKFSCSKVANPGLSNGIIQNSNQLDGKVVNFCDTYSVVIVAN